jgi:hypothetical protein
MARVSTLTVTDTFGDVKTIQPASDLDPTWAMFRLSETGVTATSPPRPFKDLLFLAPTVVGGLGGGVLEDVLLARDEMANLAWAIERKIEGPRGSGLDRHEAFQAKQRRDPPPPPPPPPPGGGVAERRYILQTTVPDYWLPLVPVQVPGTTTQLRFRRGLVDRPGGPIPAQGQILEPEHALILNPEEVPRVGARITRAFGLARWTGGQTQLWVGRRKTVSRGESSSGLRYDQAE